IHVLPNTPVAAASPVTDQLNIFVVDAHGNLQASVWAPYLGGWTSWRQIGGVQLNAGDPVTAISRGSGQLELFVVLNQQVWTQGSPSLSSGFNSNSWRPISGLTPAEWRGSAVTAVS